MGCTGLSMAPSRPGPIFSYGRSIGHWDCPSRQRPMYEALDHPVAVGTVSVTTGRSVRVGDAHADLPLYRVEEQPAGARAAGPAVLEEAFFTCRIDAGWSFEVSDAGDVLLTRE